MKIHILGICGTFMAGVAILARQLGHEVTGSDSNIYPPMSDLLNSNGIDIHNGYSPEPLNDNPDLVIIGNALSRGNPSVEFVLNGRMPYTSGPGWLAETVLPQRRVIAIAGTHGKTTTTSMTTWILEEAGFSPGFLIGGVDENFGTCARLGDSDYFIVEADEYDTAFFDKRSKFIHYHPDILVINNIEYDHADIFDDIGDILREFRRLVAIIPENGTIIYRLEDKNIQAVLASGCWSGTHTFGADEGDWQYQPVSPDFSSFDIFYQGNKAGQVTWNQVGQHNALNALAAIGVSDVLGIEVEKVARSLTAFKGVKRRLEKLAEIQGISIYDDFAHHPTAINATLTAVRSHAGNNRLIAVFEPRSNTMKMGKHKSTLGEALNAADVVYAFSPDGLGWDMNDIFNQSSQRHKIFTSVDDIVDDLVRLLLPGDQVVIMSNGAFGGIHQLLINALQVKS